MKRGTQTITNFFNSADSTEPTKFPKGKKGHFTGDRDECLFYRFYYYYHLKQIRFDIALGILVKEFFVSESTLTSRMTKDSEGLRRIIAENKPVKVLKKMYPHLNWN